MPSEGSDDEKKRLFALSEGSDDEKKRLFALSEGSDNMKKRLFTLSEGSGTSKKPFLMLTTGVGTTRCLGCKHIFELQILILRLNGFVLAGVPAFCRISEFGRCEYKHL